MDLAYKACYSRSLAHCAFCKSRIPRGALQFAHVFQSLWFGFRRRTYHFRCFFRKHRPKTVADIENFGCLRRHDRQRIQKIIRNPANGAIEDFQIGYSKLNGKNCNGCEVKIMKKQIRVSRIDYARGFRMKFSLRKRIWHHLACFVKLREKLGFYACGDLLPGFKTLKMEDRKDVILQLPRIKQNVRRSKSNRQAKRNKKEMTVVDCDLIDKEIREQTGIILTFREELQKHLNRIELRFLLQENEQEIPIGEGRMLDRLADLMTFGRLLPCAECGNGQMVLKNEGYICDGDMTFLHLSKCKILVLNPKRGEFIVPPKLKETYSFLNSYKYVPRIRVFKPIKVEQSIKAESGIKAKQTAQVEQTIKPDQIIKVEETTEAEQIVKVEPMITAEQMIKVEPMIKAEQMIKVEEIKTEQNENSVFEFVQYENRCDQDYNYKLGYALSNRSTCRNCHVKIAKYALRVSHRVLVETYRWSGCSDEWYHFNCFFKKFEVNSVAEFEDFSKLQPDDQKRVFDKIVKRDPLNSKIKMEIFEEYFFNI